jgi:hypothetical protein
MIRFPISYNVTWNEGNNSFSNIIEHQIHGDYTPIIYRFEAVGPNE